MQDMKNQVNDDDIEIRRKAVVALEGKPPEVAVPLFLRAMEDTSWRVRKTASEMLMRSCSVEHYIHGLIQLLSVEGNAGARNAAIETLIRLNRTATPFLIDAYGTADHDVRKFIVDIVGEVKDKKALPLLMRALKDDDENVRASAVEHLGHMGDPSVVNELITILESGDLWTAFPAADALGRIGDKRAIPPLLKALTVKALREPALKGLGHLSAPETLGQIVPFLMDPSKTIQEEAARTISILYHRGVPADEISAALYQSCGNDVISRLVSLAWAKKAEVRTLAILLLGLMKDKRSLDPLLELSLDESLAEDVKRALVFIGKGSPAYLVPLFDTDNPHQKRFITEVAVSIASPVYTSVFMKLLKGSDGHLRSLAALGLARLHEVRAIPDIMELLSDPFEDVQEAGVAALSAFEEGVKSEQLLPYLKDRNPALRRNAALLLGKLGAAGSVGALGFTLKDEDVSVRRAVIDALSSIRTEACITHLVLALTDENSDVRISAALSLGSIGGAGITGQLILLLTDSDDTVRVAAVKSLGMVGDEHTVKHLIPMLRDANGFVVVSALESLGRIGGGEARAALLPMLQSPDQEIRRTAIRSLSTFDGIEDVVIPYLKDPDWAMRAVAVETLSRRKSAQVRVEIENLYDGEEDPVVRKAIEDCFDIR